MLMGRDKYSQLDIRVRVKGGGHVAQAYAIRQALAKALVAYYQKCVLLRSLDWCTCHALSSLCTSHTVTQVRRICGTLLLIRIFSTLTQMSMRAAKLRSRQPCFSTTAHSLCQTLVAVNQRSAFLLRTVVIALCCWHLGDYVACSPVQCLKCLVLVEDGSPSAMFTVC